MYNVFSSSRALELGITTRIIKSAAKCCIVRIAHGYYAVQKNCADPAHAVFRQWIDVPDDLGEPAHRTAEFQRGINRHLGLIAARGPLAPEQFLTHRSAAVARRIPLAFTSLDRVEVADPEKRKQTTAVLRHRQRIVPAEYVRADCAYLPGVRATTDIWTVANLLRDGTELDGFVAADAYIGGIADSDLGILVSYPGHHRLSCSEEDLAEERNARRKNLDKAIRKLGDLNSRRGIKRAHRLLGMTTGLAESAFESLTLLALTYLGITGIQQQVEFPYPGDPRKLDRVDFYIPHLGLIIEADGWGKYEEFGPRMKESVRRDRRLERHGRLLHVEWNEIMPRRDGYGIASRLRDLGIHV